MMRKHLSRKIEKLSSLNRRGTRKILQVVFATEGTGQTNELSQLVLIPSSSESSKKQKINDGKSGFNAS